MLDQATRSTGRPTQGRRRLELEHEARLADSLALISEHFVGKKLGTRTRVFMAIWERCLDGYAQRGARQVPVERQMLSEQAGVHIETLDAAVSDLERLGLIGRQRRRVNYSRNLANLWSLEGTARLVSESKADTGTKTLTFVVEVPDLVYISRSKAATPRKREGRSDTDFRWSTGTENHPALNGLDQGARSDLAHVYMLVREHLIGAGNVRSVPEGGWLSAIRAYYESFGREMLLGCVEEALANLAMWLDEGGSTAYSFAWMHKYRRSECPPPSLLFSLFSGDDDDRSLGEDPLAFWTYYSG